MVTETAQKAILMVDDDAEDCLFTRKAFQTCGVPNPFFSFLNGELLMDYLRRHGPQSGREEPVGPLMILLDLHMPQMDGRRILEKIKGDEDLRKIPVIVFSDSHSPDDILFCYRQGANSYIAKPASLEGAVALVRSLKRYWLETVKLPPA